MTDRRPQDQMLLHAALDGELDAVGMIELEAKLAADPALAVEYARLAALRDAIRARIPRQMAPESLRARVIAVTQTVNRAPPTTPRRLRLLDAPYRSLAASLMLGIALGAGAYGLLFRQPPTMKSSAPSSPGLSGVAYQASPSMSRHRIGTRSSRGWPAKL